MGVSARGLGWRGGGRGGAAGAPARPSAAPGSARWRWGGHTRGRGRDRHSTDGSRWHLPGWCNQERTIGSDFTNYRYAMTFCVHALDVRVVIPSLGPVGTGTCGIRSSHCAKQQTCAGTNASPLIAADRCTCRSADDRTQDRTAHRTVIRSLIRTESTNLRCGVASTNVIVEAKRLKAFSSSWQGEHAGSRGHTRASGNHENTGAEQQGSELNVRHGGFRERQGNQPLGNCGATSCQGLAHCATFG